MKATEFITESVTPLQKKQFLDMFKKFLPLAMQHIKLDRLPKMEFLSSIKDIEQPTFGRYVNDEQTLYVALSNRHPVDILRTIAHELQHYKQDIENALNADSGSTGSREENEANAVAGIVMRHFNKQYPEFLKTHPIVAEGVAVEPDPRGYQKDLLTTPKNTLVIDTPGDLDWYKIGQHYPSLGSDDPHEYGQGDSDMTITPANKKELEILKKNLDRLKLRYKEIGGSFNQPEIHDKLGESSSNYEIRNLEKLDNIIVKLCELIVKNQHKDSEHYGMVAAAVLDPDNNIVARTSTGSGPKWRHAERNAIDAYEQKYGNIPDGSIILTTLSPCSEYYDITAQERDGESCTTIINDSTVHKVYCGYVDPTQNDDKHAEREFTMQESNNPHIRRLCKKFSDTFLKPD